MALTLASEEFAPTKTAACHPVLDPSVEQYDRRTSLDLFGLWRTQFRFRALSDLVEYINSPGRKAGRKDKPPEFVFSVVPSVVEAVVEAAVVGTRVDLTVLAS